MATTSTFYGLEIAKTGLFTARNAMEVTGHNISNVDTVGYTRQRLYTAALDPTITNSLIASNHATMVGMGVEAIVIEQIRNPFLDTQYREANSIEVMWTIQEQYFGYVEDLLNNELDPLEDSTGFLAMLNSFYESLDELATDGAPDLELRTNVQQNAIIMVDTLNYYYDRLLQQQTTLNETVAATVTQVNTMLSEIAALNEDIYAYELTGANANDLRDQRNVILDELSGMINMSYSESLDGKLTVKIDGEEAVYHTDYLQLDVMIEQGNNGIIGENVPDMYEVVWQDELGNPTDEKVYITSGALKGYLNTRDGADEENYGIPHVVNQLATLSQKIVMEVNSIHRKGYTMPYDTNESRTDVDFFYQPDDSDFRAGALADGYTDAQINAADFNLYYEGNPAWEEVTARTIRLSDDILKSVYNIASSDVMVDLTADNEQRGNNLIALELAQLLTRTDEAGNPDNFDSMYRLIVTGLGLNQSTIISFRKSQTVVTSQIEMQRMAVSGVSLDEEMSNLIRFEHAYNAASRIITAVDEQLDTIINRMGTVGR